VLETIANIPASSPIIPDAKGGYHRTAGDSTFLEISGVTTTEIVGRYAPLLARLRVAEGILQRRLSPTETDEPGDYRSFTVEGILPHCTHSAGLSLSVDSPITPISPLTPSRSNVNTQEFFVRNTGSASWKSRFLRRGSATTSVGSPTSSSRTATPSLSRGSSDYPLRTSEDFRGGSAADALTALAAEGKSRREIPSPSIILHDALPEMRAMWNDPAIRMALSIARRQQDGAVTTAAVEDVPGL